MHLKNMKSTIVLKILVVLLFTLGCFAQMPIKKYELRYTTPASNSNEGWEDLSLPLGNGYFGVNVFGGVATERLQLSEKSMYMRDTTQTNSSYKTIALTNFGETYIEFPHSEKEVTHYERKLDIRNATATVSYTYQGVDYKREFFTSYPDKVMVVKITASTPGKVSFTLRPKHIFLGSMRQGTVKAANDRITMSGVLEPYKLLFEAQYRVKNYGGTISSQNDASGSNGTITVQNADTAVIVMALGTNYMLSPAVLEGDNKDKVTIVNKLKDQPNPNQRISKIVDSAFALNYEQLFKNHLEDYSALFSRVAIDLGEKNTETATDKLLADYKNGNESRYLEELYFQYGRYLLIASSRKGTLPANLQGTWNALHAAPWTGGYWLNINYQMNYWPAFQTNLAETFTPYLDYIEATVPSGQNRGSEFVKKYNSKNFSEEKGACGWTIGTGNSPYKNSNPGPTSGFGTGPFVCQSIWDYYEFTKDIVVLKRIYPTIKGSSDFTSRIVREIPEFKNLLLCSPSWSPESWYFTGPNAKKYIDIPGTAYDQQLIYQGHLNTISAAKILGTDANMAKMLEKQLPLLDPVQIGASGQVKEFRTENEYSQFGDPAHRHISQLIGLFPGTIINETTPKWLEGAKVTLTKRGDRATGWAVAHKMNMWARVKDGNHAYTLYQNLLKFNTKNNLWDTHPPFQIDGNLGGTAGVAEMLLQSHAGYIEPLAALPDSWKTGSFNGLVARGNFEIAAQWSDKKLSQLKIKSNAGEVCRIFYPKIEKSKLKSTTGKVLHFKKVKNNLIRFETVQGQEYILEL
jgi:alpha-L-fucosidase 2